ncbi:MAG: ABC transporter permease [Lachnospiraceae bacterium]
MIKQIWKMAWSAVRSNKIRTFLSMLGICIGVAALIVLVSIADGATSSVTDQISSIGSDYLTVRITDDKENPIRLEELNSLFDEKEIEAAAPFTRSSATAKTTMTSDTMQLYGTTGSYFEIMQQELFAGRFLKQTDVENHTSAIVLTYDTAVELFGYANVEGETFSLDGRTFTVVGVLSEETNTTTSLFGSSDEETVTLEGYIPYSTLSRLKETARSVSNVYISAVENVSMDEAQAAVEQALLSRLKNDEDAFSVQSQSEIMEAREEVSHTMSLLIGGIAAISLLVGGIGIMNIMLVSVTERTKEIGIRKAIGAGQGSILLQFLMEAVIVSLAGCLCGILFSIAALKIAGICMGDSMQLTMNGTVVWISVAFSCVIGVVFGLYPAKKAASKKPIDALRFQ